MNKQRRLKDVVNLDEFYIQTDKKTSSERIQWDELESDLNIVAHNGGFELLEDLIRFHRHGTCIDPQKTHFVSCLDTILCSCTPRLFEVIFPGIQSHPGIYSEFSRPLNASIGLQFVRRDEIDDFIFDYHLSAYDIVKAWDQCCFQLLPTGPTSDHILRFLVVNGACASDQSLFIGPLSCETRDEEMDELIRSNPGYCLDNINTLTYIIDMMSFEKGRVFDEVFYEIVELLVGLLSEKECKWIVSFYLGTHFWRLSCDGSAFHAFSMVLFKATIDVQPAYWYLCRDAWKKRTDDIQNRLEKIEYKSIDEEPFSAEFKQCRDQLDSILNSHIFVSGVSKLVCVYLIGGQSADCLATNK